ncbi:MAG: ribosome recycling factor [Patescibacteria group bacterium]|jgi:ribosome recycling factor
MSVDNLLKEAKPKMLAAIENLKEELSRVRTGRANPAILDGVMVPYYGSSSTISAMASVSVPEANQIVIKPWDRNVLGDIETAIRASNVGLNPVNDGQQIRLVLPPMTEERRRDIVTQVKKSGEETKVSLRNVRREIWDKVQTAEKNKEVTEDDRYRAEDELNKIVTEMNSTADRVVAEKEQEIMKI